MATAFIGAIYSPDSWLGRHTGEVAAEVRTALRELKARDGVTETAVPEGLRFESEAERWSVLVAPAPGGPGGAVAQLGVTGEPFLAEEALDGLEAVPLTFQDCLA